MTSPLIARTAESVPLRAPAEAGSATARAHERLLALGIDLGLLVITAPITLGICAAFLREYWAVGAVLIVIGYVATSWMTSGQTVGMHMLGLRLVDAKSRRLPSPGAALLRACLVVLPLTAGAVLLNASTGAEGAPQAPEDSVGLTAGFAPVQPQPERSTAEVAALVGISAMLFVAASAWMWTLIDPRRRSLHDIVSGLLLERSRP